MADPQHMPTKATATDTLGCSLKALSDNEMIVSRTITFHRKASKGGTPGEVVMPESDRGYLIGLSRLGGHRRRIMRPHLAIETEFAENSLYVRRLSDPYRATLAGSFDFTLAEVTPAALTRLAHEIDRPDISELGEVGSEADPVLGGLLGALFSTAGQPGPKSMLFVDQLSIAIGMHLLTRYGNGRRLATHRRQTFSQRQRTRMEELLQGEGRVPSIEELALDCGLSQAAFLKAFQTTFGISPHQFIVKARIERACAEIISSGKTLSEIARACGFFDQSHFTRAFVKAKGTTPAQWRKSRLS
jgi:AraC family transcriptional regulator